MPLGLKILFSSVIGPNSAIQPITELKRLLSEPHLEGSLQNILVSTYFRPQTGRLPSKR